MPDAAVPEYVDIILERDLQFWSNHIRADRSVGHHLG